jgi:hypothetical protein
MGAVRNAYRILVRKCNADPSSPNAREIPSYIVQVYFILTSIIYSEMMRLWGVASEKMEYFTVARFCVMCNA